MARFRVVSWNVDSRPTGRFDAKLELLHRLEPDLALLRELRRPVYRGFIPHAQAYERLHGRPRLFAWGVLSTDVIDPPAPDRRVGCAVLGGRSTALLEVTALGARAVAVRVALAGGVPVTACTAQSRRAVTGEETTAREPDLAAWIATIGAPVVAAIDARASTGLAGARTDLVAADAGGPPGLAARHDTVLATADLCVREVAYLEDEALAAGSDHGLVVVDLEWNGEPGDDPIT